MHKSRYKYFIRWNLYQMIHLPGKAINASAWRAISALRWCMPDTALTSPTVSPVIWHNIADYSVLFSILGNFLAVKKVQFWLPLLAWESLESLCSRRKKRFRLLYVRKRDREREKERFTLTRGDHHRKQLERPDPSDQCFLLHKPSQCSSPPAIIFIIIFYEETCQTCLINK